MKSPSKGKLRTVQADVPESEILRACLAYLDECGILAWRNNSGRTKIGPRWVSFGLKGSGDILGILPDGRFLSVECKTASGRVSPDQESFMDKVRVSGGVALVVHSAEELADGLGLKSYPCFRRISEMDLANIRQECRAETHKSRIPGVYGRS